MGGAPGEEEMLPFGSTPQIILFLGGGVVLKSLSAPSCRRSSTPRSASSGGRWWDPGAKPSPPLQIPLPHQVGLADSEGLCFPHWALRVDQPASLGKPSLQSPPPSILYLSLGMGNVGGGVPGLRCVCECWGGFVERLLTVALLFSQDVCVSLPSGPLWSPTPSGKLWGSRLKFSGRQRFHNPQEDPAGGMATLRIPGRILPAGSPLSPRQDEGTSLLGFFCKLGCC